MIKHKAPQGVHQVAKDKEFMIKVIHYSPNLF